MCVLDDHKFCFVYLFIMKKIFVFGMKLEKKF